MMVDFLSWGRSEAHTSTPAVAKGAGLIANAAAASSAADVPWGSDGIAEEDHPKSSSLLPLCNTEPPLTLISLSLSLWYRTILFLGRKKNRIGFSFFYLSLKANQHPKFPVVHVCTAWHSTWNQYGDALTTGNDDSLETWGNCVRGWCIYLTIQQVGATHTHKKGATSQLVLFSPSSGSSAHRFFYFARV